MNSKIILAIIVFFFIVVIIFASNAQPKDTSTKLCLESKYYSSVFECQSNELNVKYFKTYDKTKIADAPDVYYTLEGKELYYCDGFNTQEEYEKQKEICTQLKALNCSKKINC